MTLPGDIREYELINKSKKLKTSEMPDNEAADVSATAQMEMMKKQMDLMSKMLETMNLQNGQSGDAKQKRISDGPVKSKNKTLEAWLEEIELWNKSNDVAEKDLGNKYLKLTEAIEKSEDEDLKEVCLVRSAKRWARRGG